MGFHFLNSPLRPIRASIPAGIALCLVVAACGSATPTPTPTPSALANSPTHGSPAGAVIGAINDLANNQPLDLANWVDPADSSNIQTRAALTSSAGITLSVKGSNPHVRAEHVNSSDPNTAVVQLASDLQVCSTTPGQNPTCAPLDFGGGAAAGTVNTLRVDGKWYVLVSTATSSPSPSGSATANNSSSSPTPTATSSSGNSGTNSGLPIGGSGLPPGVVQVWSGGAGGGDVRKNLDSLHQGWGFDYLWDCSSFIVPAGSQIHIQYKSNATANNRASSGDIQAPEISQVGPERNEMNANNAGSYSFDISSPCPWMVIVRDPLLNSP